MLLLVYWPKSRIVWEIWERGVDKKGGTGPARRTSREPSLLNKPLGERKRDRELKRRLGTVKKE